MMQNEIHIDTSGMNDTEIVVTLITEIFNHVGTKKKRKAKEIRDANRRTDL